MSTHSFKWNGATITVRPGTARDIMQRRMIQARFIDAVDDIERIALFTFTQVVTQTTSIDGDVPFALPAGYNVESLRASLDAFLDMPQDLLLAWERALDAVDTPPGDPDLAPGDGKKKTSG